MLRPSRVRRAAFLVTGLGSLALIAFLLRPRPVAVEAQAARQTSMQVTVDENGVTRVRERYVVSSPLAGRLQRITLEPGDAVEAARTLLATIAPSDPQLLDVRARAEAEARVRTTAAVRRQAAPNLERARAAYDLAAAELTRAEELYKTSLVSHQELDIAEQRARVAAEEFKAAQFAVQIAEFELQQAKAALLHSRGDTAAGIAPVQFDILAPITGRVLRVLQESATVVGPGTPLVEIGDPRHLEILIDVLSADAVRIPAGAPVRIEQWGGDTVLAARVRRVEPAGFLKLSALGVEEQRVHVLADFEGSPDGRAALGDAYRVEARIVVWEAPDVLTIPAGALFRDGRGWAAYTVQQGRARQRSVQVGHTNGLVAEITGGLSAGDVVILHPGDRIRDGVRVAARPGG